MSKGQFVCPYCGEKFTMFEEQAYCPRCGQPFDAQHRPIYDQVSTSWGNAGITLFKIFGYLFLFVFLAVFLNVFGVIIFFILVIIFHYAGKKLSEPNTYTCPYCGKQFKGQKLNCPYCGGLIRYNKK